MFALILTKDGRIVVPMADKTEEQLNKEYKGQLEAVYDRLEVAEADKERFDRLDD
jgi:hypothetical protein